jgi:hypothetical protein
VRLFRRRETLHEQLVREAGLSPQRGRRRPIRTWRAKREQQKLVEYIGEHGYLSEQEAARGREQFRLRAPDEPPPGFG